MSHSRKKSTLSLEIKQGSKTFERSLQAHEKLTIGHSPENDVIIYGEHIPKKHTLIECSGKNCRLNLDKNMSGEIRFQDSLIHFDDLLKHELLPQKGDIYNLDFPRGRRGLVNIADAQIYFTFDGLSKISSKVPGYSWYKATTRSVTKDLIFKILLTLFLSLEIFAGFYLSTIEIPPDSPPDVNKVPQRFAKFMIKQPAPKPETTITSTNGSGVGESEEEGTASEEKKTRQKPKGGGGSGDTTTDKPVTSQGLLGLIGGTGASAQSSSAADFLIDQGLVQELDQMLGRKPLLKGKGKGNGVGRGTGNGVGSGDGVDDLMSIGLAGGIDDLLTDVGGVESVGLTKKSRVNIEQPRQLRGSQAALGQRSADDVMALINSQQGRIQYYL